MTLSGADAAEPGAGPRGVSASPHPFEEVQPDGTRITLRIRGDEYYHWFEDPAGFSVLRDRGAYVYARKDARGRLAPTSLRVGRADPAAAGLAPQVRPEPAVLRQHRVSAQGAPAAAAQDSGPRPVGATGTTRNVVILIRFSNHGSRILPSPGDFDTIFNAVGGDSELAETGSVRDYFLETSYGKFELNSTVYGWVDLPQTEQYYANGASGLDAKIQEAIISALELADPLIDFDDFDQNNDFFVDSITFIHSGYGAEWGGTDADGHDSEERIWSHRWSIPTWTSDEGVSVSSYHISTGLWGLSGSQPGRIGVICHETGHFLGLPDLYDTNGGGEGIGSYGLMANSWGFDGSQLHPPHMSAWSKIQLGWITPTLISASGNYLAPQAQTQEVIYRIDNGYPSGEYLLIENRQPVGFESVMPQGGLAVYHIDELAGDIAEGFPGQAGWPQNGRHYRVALLQADGNYDLERGIGRGDSGDLFHAGGRDLLGSYTVPMTNAYQGGSVQVTNNRIDAISASGAEMTFRYSSLGPAAETAALANISTRGRVQTGDEVMIGGFILEGDEPKTVLIRAVGPSLGELGVPGVLDDPLVELFSGTTLLESNDDWRDSQEAEIQATDMAPSDDREAALLVTLEPGPYTAIVRGKDESLGVGLVEVFDVDESGGGSLLFNISTRGVVLTDDNVMIGGFIIEGDSPRTVLIRAIGPKLADLGVAGSLSDPVLQIFSGATRIAENDNWNTGFQRAEIEASIPPEEPAESAVMMTLDPGPYTAIVRGAEGSDGPLTGVALVEVFTVNE